MLSRKPTTIRKTRRRSNSRHTTRRCSAPTVLGPPASLTLFKSDSNLASMLSLTPQTSCTNVNQLSSSSRSISFRLPPRISESVSLTTVAEPEHESSKRMLSFQTPPPEKVFYDSTVVWPEIEDEEAGVSVFSGICEAGLESRGPCEFLHRAFFLLSGTWPVTVFLVILLALPLVMTTIGVNYLHDCPREPKLPIYLVVGGCFGILKLVFLLWKQVRRHKDVTDLHDDEDLLTMTRMTNIALNIFLTIWFVFGHYWVVGIWKPHFTAPLHEPRNWCERTVFLFSFWQLVICHIIIALLVAVGFLLLCCYTCVKCLMPENKR